MAHRTFSHFRAVGSAAATLALISAAVLFAGSPAGATARMSPHGPAGTTRPADQCAKPLSQRVGGWACAEAVQPRPSTPTAFATGVGNWCLYLGSVPGCWQVNPSNRAHAEFHTNNGVYGYGYGSGAKLLGKVSLLIEWTLSGPRIIAKPVQIRNTHSTSKPCSPVRYSTVRAT